MNVHLFFVLRFAETETGAQGSGFKVHRGADGVSATQFQMLFVQQIDDAITRCVTLHGG